MGSQAKLVLTEHQVKMVLLDLEVKWGHRALLVMPDPMAHPVKSAPKDKLELLERQVKLEEVALRESADPQEHQELTANRGQLGLQGLLGLQVPLALLSKGRKETEELQDPTGPPGKLVLKVSLVLQETLDPKGRLDSLDHLGLLEPLDLLATLERLELLERMANLAHLDQGGYPALLVTQDSPGPTDSREHRVR